MGMHQMRQGFMRTDVGGRPVSSLISWQICSQHFPRYRLCCFTGPGADRDDASRTSWLSHAVCSLNDCLSIPNNLQADAKSCRPRRASYAVAQGAGGATPGVEGSLALWS